MKGKVKFLLVKSKYGFEMRVYTYDVYSKRQRDVTRLPYTRNRLVTSVNRNEAHGVKFSISPIILR